MTGELTIHGVTRPVTFEGEYAGPHGNPFGDEDIHWFFRFDPGQPGGFRHDVGKRAYGRRRTGCRQSGPDPSGCGSGHGGVNRGTRAVPDDHRQRIFPGKLVALLPLLASISAQRSGSGSRYFFAQPSVILIASSRSTIFPGDTNRGATLCLVLRTRADFFVFMPQGGPVPLVFSRLPELAHQPGLGAPDRRLIEHYSKMAGAPDAPGMRNALPVYQNHVRLCLQSAQGGHDGGTFEEQQVAGHIRKEDFFRCRALLKEHQIRISVEACGCIYVIFSKSSIHTRDEPGLFGQRAYLDTMPVPFLEIARFSEAFWPYYDRHLHHVFGYNYTILHVVRI